MIPSFPIVGYTRDPTSSIKSTFAAHLLAVIPLVVIALVWLTCPTPSLANTFTVMHGDSVCLYWLPVEEFPATASATLNVTREIYISKSISGYQSANDARPRILPTKRRPMTIRSRDRPDVQINVRLADVVSDSPARDYAI